MKANLVEIRYREKLTEEAIRNVFRGLDPNTVWYRSVLQIIEGWKLERESAVIEFQRDGNALGMAGASGGMDMLNTLVADFESRRKA